MERSIYGSRCEDYLFSIHFILRQSTRRRHSSGSTTMVLAVDFSLSLFRYQPSATGSSASSSSSRSGRMAAPSCVVCQSRTFFCAPVLPSSHDDGVSVATTIARIVRRGDGLRPQRNWGRTEDDDPPTMRWTSSSFLIDWNTQ
jgi:hypothetical protein